MIFDMLDGVTLREVGLPRKRRSAGNPLACRWQLKSSGKRDVWEFRTRMATERTSFNALLMDSRSLKISRRRRARNA
jgi:hypothetical protein